MATNPFSSITLRDLGDINQVKAYTLSLYDQSLAVLAQAAAFIDTSAAVAQINSVRAQTVALFDRLTTDLSSLTSTFPLGTPLADIFSQVYGSDVSSLDFSQFLGGSGLTIPSFPPITITPTPAPAPGTLPSVIPVAPLPPSGDGVRIFGDTPLLLRETDPTIPDQAAFLRVGSGMEFVSPEVSTTTLKIGSYTAPDLNSLWDVLADATKISGKGLIGAAIKSLPVGADFLSKASDIREIGDAQNIVLGGTMGMLQNAIRVANGSMSLSEFETQQDRFFSATEGMFNGKRSIDPVLAEA